MPSSLPPEPATTAPAPAPPSAPTATEALYRAALAEGDIGYYLPVFADFDDRGVSRPRWNPAAALLNINWLLYRRLWRAAALHALACAAAGLALWWAGPSLGALGPMLWLFLLAMAIAVPGLWGNAWLHDDVRRRMTAAVRRARTVQEACDALQHQDRQRPVLLGAAVLQVMVFTLIGLDSRPQAVPARTTDAPEVATPTPAALPASASLAEPVPAPTAVPLSASATQPPPPSALPPDTVPAPPPVAEQPVPADVVVRPRWRGHGVNVGMFADAANAERVRQRLTDAGLPVLIDTVESARGPLARVRVGPFPDALAATKAAETVRAVGLEARVFGP